MIGTIKKTFNLIILLIKIGLKKEVKNSDIKTLKEKYNFKTEGFDEKLSSKSVSLSYIGGRPDER